MPKFTFVEVQQSKDRQTQREFNRNQRFRIHSHAATIAQQQLHRKRKPPPNRRKSAEVPLRPRPLDKPPAKTGDGQNDIDEISPGVDSDEDEQVVSTPTSVSLQSEHAIRSRLRHLSPYIKMEQPYSEFTLRAVDWFVNILTPAQLVVDGVFRVNTVYTGSLLQIMLSAEEHGYGGVASVNASVHQVKDPNQIPVPVILETCKAISYHRNHLESLRGQSDDLAIITNLILTSIADGMDDLQSIVVFRHHLKSLIAAAGGFQGTRLSQLVLAAVLQWESCSSLVLGSPSEFADKYPLHVPYYPSEPFSSEVRRRVSILPPGFQQLASKGRLALNTLELLGSVTNTAKTSASPNPANPKLRPFVDNANLFTSYWEACPCLSYPDDAEGRPNFEKILVMGVIMYCYHALAPIRTTSMFYRACRKRLTADITRYPCGGVDFSREEKDVLLWACLNAVDAWQPPDAPLSPTAEALLVRAWKAFPDNVVDGEVALEDRMRKFFWNEAFILRCQRFSRRAPTRQARARRNEVS